MDHPVELTEVARSLAALLQQKPAGSGSMPPASGCSWQAVQHPCCQVCFVQLEEAYCKRYKVCRPHMTADEVLLDGQLQRFCQQCARFHPLELFSGRQRSCREQLARHAERRRVGRATARRHRSKQGAAPRSKSGSPEGPGASSAGTGADSPSRPSAARSSKSGQAHSGTAVDGSPLSALTLQLPPQPLQQRPPKRPRTLPPSPPQPLHVLLQPMQALQQTQALAPAPAPAWPPAWPSVPGLGMKEMHSLSSLLSSSTVGGGGALTGGLSQRMGRKPSMESAPSVSQPLALVPPATQQPLQLTSRPSAFAVPEATTQRAQQRQALQLQLQQLLQQARVQPQPLATTAQLEPQLELLLQLARQLVSAAQGSSPRPIALQQMQKLLQAVQQRGKQPTAPNQPGGQAGSGAAQRLQDLAQLAQQAQRARAASAPGEQGPGGKPQAQPLAPRPPPGQEYCDQSKLWQQLFQQALQQAQGQQKQGPQPQQPLRPIALRPPPAAVPPTPQPSAQAASPLCPGQPPLAASPQRPPPRQHQAASPLWPQQAQQQAQALMNLQAVLHRLPATAALLGIQPAGTAK